MYSEVLDLNQLTMLHTDGSERPVNTVIDSGGEGNVMKEVIPDLEDACASQNTVDNVYIKEGLCKTECDDIGEVTKDIETVSNGDSAADTNQLNRTPQYCCRCLKERQPTKDNRLSSVATSVTTLGCDCCLNSFGRSDEKVQQASRHRTRWKSRRLHIDTRDNRLFWSHSARKSWRTVLIKKTTMLRMLCHCVVLIVVFACGGVLMMSHKQHNRHTGDILSKPTLPSGFTFEDYNEVHHSGDDHIIRDLPFRKVSREEFEKHMLTAKSSADLLKIFFDDPNLTDEQVDIILRMKAHSRLHSTDWSRETEGTYVNDGRNLNDEHKQLAYKNLEETWKNPYHICNDPRPEIVRVESVESGVIRTFYPDCTVVHRCRNTSGCCPKGSECGPKTVGSFTKYFHVFENSMDGSFLRPVIQVTEPRTFLNHTSCECKKIETKSNCVKKCPSQFNQERTGINCECKCNRHNKKCLRIQKGFIPLDEHDLMCIKSDECLIPTCIVGEFRVRSGFCPHVGRHHHRISD